MRARDAKGRQVSLLNDEPSYYSSERPSYVPPPQQQHHHQQLQYSSSSSSSSGNTPELHRSDSYDSNGMEPISPLTPTAYDFRRGGPVYAVSQTGYDEYPSTTSTSSSSHRKRPSYTETVRSASYEDESSSSGAAAGAAAAADRPAKRYPCRYRDSHGCEKTFTTSGHASRHSKIHTAEKAVQCTFRGCQKKFTRADNMKQHLETHYKDKSRASGSGRTSKSTSSSSGSGSGSSSRKHSSSKHSSSSSSRAQQHHHHHHHHHHHATTIEYEQYPSPHGVPLASPGVSDMGAWDLRGLNLPLMSRPSAARTQSSGLDALAMAVACQERA